MDAQVPGEDVGSDDWLGANFNAKLNIFGGSFWSPIIPRINAPQDKLGYRTRHKPQRQRSWGPKECHAIVKRVQHPPAESRWGKKNLRHDLIYCDDNHAECEQPDDRKDKYKGGVIGFHGVCMGA